MTDGPARPPRLALLLLRILIPGDAGEFIEGDLVEEFSDHVVRERGRRAARRWFWWQVLASGLRRRRSRTGGWIRRVLRSGGRRVGVEGRPGWLSLEKEPLLATLLQDARSAIRLLRRRPGFAIPAVVTLAIGVGAGTSVFSVADWLLFRPVPGVEAPADRLALVQFEKPNGTVTGVSSSNLLDLEAGAPAVEVLAGTAITMLQVAGEGFDPLTVRAEAVTRGYFDLLEVPPARGRLFSQRELQPDNERRVVVISHDFWEERLRSDPSIVGRSLVLNGFRYTVIGVAGETFRGLDRIWRTELWVPGSLYFDVGHYSAEWIASRAGLRPFMTTVVRIARGSDPAQAEVQLREVMARLIAAHPDENEIYRENPPTIHAGIGLPPVFRPRIRRMVTRMFAAAMLLLLIACANQSNLFALRARIRGGETALRKTLGASRFRLTRERLAEVVILSLGAAVLSAGVAWGLNTVLWREEGIFLSSIAFEPRVDLRALVFALTLALSVPLLFTLLPAVRTGRTNLAQMGSSAGRTPTVRNRLVRNALVVVQLSLSLALLVGSLLLVQTLRGLRGVEIGFDPSNLLAFAVDPGLQGYEEAEIPRFHLELVERARTFEGVSSATVARVEPFHPNSAVTRVLRHEVTGGAEPIQVGIEWIGPGYFETLRVPMLSGRGFREEEMDPGFPDSESSVVINASLAGELFGSTDPIGETVVIQGYRENTEKRVVGVVPDLRNGQRGEAESRLYATLPGSYTSAATVLLRTSRPPEAVSAALRDALESLDPNVSLFRSESVTRTIESHADEERLLARLMLILSLVGWILTIVGLYAVVGQSVAERTREIGIRMAIGADRSRIVTTVVGEVMRLAVAGLAIGYGVSVVLADLLRSRLFGIDPFDARTWGAAAVVLAATALTATIAPIRRAAGVDAAEALRFE